MPQMDEFEKTSIANNLRVVETTNSSNNVSTNNTTDVHNIDTISEEASVYFCLQNRNRFLQIATLRNTASICIGNDTL